MLNKNSLLSAEAGVQKIVEGVGVMLATDGVVDDSTIRFFVIQTLADVDLNAVEKAILISKIEELLEERFGVHVGVKKGFRGNNLNGGLLYG